MMKLRLTDNVKTQVALALGLEIVDGYYYFEPKDSPALMKQALGKFLTYKKARRYKHARAAEWFFQAFRGTAILHGLETNAPLYCRLWHHGGRA